MVPLFNNRQRYLCETDKNKGENRKLFCYVTKGVLY